jgi:hypothetical protein
VESQSSRCSEVGDKIPKKDEPFATINSISIANVTFHFIKVEGGVVIAGKNIAAEINISGTAGGSYGSLKREESTILVFVSEANQVFPLNVWQEMKERLAEQTGVPVQTIGIKPKQMGSLQADKSENSSGARPA